MKLSIIVPVYRAEQYLRKCLDSLVGQTIDDYEIILINDGSPDNSQSIIEEYKAAYPDRIVSLVTDNGGQGRARNLGLDIARGEYIGFVDSDDWVDTAMYEKLYRAAKAQEADLVLCDFTEISDSGECRHVPTSDLSDRMLVQGSMCSKLTRRDLIGDIRFPCGLWYEDLAFSAKVTLKAKKLAAVPEGLYYYRISNSSTMRNNNAKKNLDILPILEDIRQFMEQNGIEGDFGTLVLNHVGVDTVNRVARQNAEDKKEVMDALLGYLRRHVPKLGACAGYTAADRNRRIIMFLNYHGLWRTSRLLLGIKSALY